MPSIYLICFNHGGWGGPQAASIDLQTVAVHWVVLSVRDGKMLWGVLDTSSFFISGLSFLNVGRLHITSRFRLVKEQV